MEVTTENSEEALLLHLDAAYNFARWLTRDGRDAEILVQEAYLRALSISELSKEATHGPGC